MSQVYFQEIDEKNERIVRGVRVKPEQEHFIETVDECLEEAAAYPEWHPVAIYSDDKVVGFAMYGCVGRNGETWIDRVIIDQDEQGKGLGRLVMTKLIDVVTRDYGVNVLYLSIIEENRGARYLYESLGFEYIHERDPNGELIFEYCV
ncbi:diamine acetyltransferase [Pontibacillus chungwhensis BH030062]|uniref:Diamine acetyltransferase n=1 Tax=Pontibacillus chungwhensis BH030062 TaxID=1385513 RepID=A0A0A2UTJ1_9BACI|nr:GNAT family N-acetyltransferase [Pontibacillus chungwhensis]KGP91239.1 diamine acetyltransferase [Pontibacillus chungwhensis BH030062]